MQTRTKNSAATLGAIAALAAACAAHSAAAAERSFDLDAGLAAGYQYDSNVGYTDIDTLSGAADTATRLRARVAAKLTLGRVTLTGGYDVDRTAWTELTAFDLDLHHVTAGVAGTFAGFDVGVTADRFDAVREDGRYLRLEQVTPGVGRLFRHSVYARLGYTAGRKSYAELPARAAGSAAVRGDVYILLDGMRRYVSLNVQHAREDALDPAFDYASVAGGLAFGQAFTSRRRAPSLKTELGYEVRDYPNVTESLGAPREERRLKAALILVLPLGEHLELKAEAARAHNDSNLAAAAYDRTSAGVTFTAEF